MKKLMLLGISSILLLTGCHHTQVKESAITPKAMVEVTSFKNGKLSESLDFQAQSCYLIKNAIVAPIDCYIQKAFVLPGDRVKKGQLLYQVVTREKKATENMKDSIYANMGIVSIRASSEGIVGTMQGQSGDFVTSGSTLCQINKSSSLVFTLQVPVEYNHLIKPEMPCLILYPGGNTISGIVKSELGQMNLNGQTRQYLLKPSSMIFIPENLLATVKITTQTISSDRILPKSCVLSDEMMQKFWVMKLINDSVAVKTSVKTGLKNREEIEIKEPVFAAGDRILSQGNYGLADTALVKLIN